MPRKREVNYYMARPKKKPGYDREAEIADLISTAAALFDVPYDDRIPRPEDAPTIKFVAEEMETTTLRVRKFLISANMYSTAISRRVQELDRDGHSIVDIMTITGLGQASVYSYLPFKKGAYNLLDPTLYSEQASRYRNRKRAVKELQQHQDCSDELDYLWKAVIAFENYPFTTSGRGKGHAGSTKFKYSISKPGGNSGRKYKGESVDGYGNEMLVTGHEKSISRSTVDLAFKNALEEQKKYDCVAGPKKLKIPGAGSYLYSLFLRFGVITAAPEEKNLDSTSN